MESTGRISDVIVKIFQLAEELYACYYVEGLVRRNATWCDQGGSNETERIMNAKAVKFLREQAL